MDAIIANEERTKKKKKTWTESELGKGKEV